MSPVQQDVEAALLNSEGQPVDEVLHAFQGIVRFARNEYGAPDDHLKHLLQTALDSQERV